MAAFLDYDPLRGMAEYQDSTYGDNRLQIHYRQDVESVLELNKQERNGGLTDYGIKNDLWLYARIPPVMILKLKYEYGLDVNNKNHLGRIFYLINTEFPYLKCTEKHHDLRGKGFD